MQPKYILNDIEYCVTPLRRMDDITLDIDGQVMDLRLCWHDEHYGELIANGTPHEFYAAQDNDKLFIHMDGRVWDITCVDEFATATASQHKVGTITAPMPGTVVEIYAEIGACVQQGQPLMIIESMKLQTEIKAEIDGCIAGLGVEVGESFDKGSLLIDIESVD